VPDVYVPTTDTQADNILKPTHRLDTDLRSTCTRTVFLKELHIEIMMIPAHRFVVAALVAFHAAPDLCHGFQGRFQTMHSIDIALVSRHLCTTNRLHVPVQQPIDSSSPFNARDCSRREGSETKLFSSELDESPSDEDSVLPSLWLFAGIPVLSLALPLLLQFKFIAPLIVFKRFYIYALAASVLVVASIRGSSDSPALGTRLIDLTREILPYDVNFDDADDDEAMKKKTDTRFQEMAVLDQVDDSAQAVGLPLIVVSSLVASLFFVLLQNSDVPTSPSSLGLPNIGSIIQPLVTASNAAVISLFARAELRRLAPSQNPNIATAGSLALTGLAFVGPAALVWPVQNILCACLAISVARAIQIPRFVPIVLALSALVAYDVVSVGIQLVNLGVASTMASDPAAQQQMASTTAPSAASSAMGAVAMAKTEAGSWQPGLFQVRLKGIATDLLGLGDAVFPSLLSTFCLRFDKELGSGDNNNASYSYFLASLVGFGVGCLSCELVPGISDTGLPALLFLVPSMLTPVVGLAAVKGDLSSLLAFDPASEEADE
jgi:hypothetical protein